MTLFSKITTAGFVGDQVKLHPELVDRVNKDSSKNLIPNAPKKYTEEHLPHIINHIVSHDPSPNNSYKKWLTSTYKSKGINKLEDLSRAKEALNLFHKHKDKLPVHERDIYKYKSLPDLEEQVQPYEAKDTSPVHEDDEFIKGSKPQATIHHNDSEYKIVTPHTTKASQHFGKNTKWCTAAKKDNYFDQYNKNGVKLHYILHKPTNTRFAIANNEMGNEYFDQQDRPFKPEDLLKDHPKLNEHLKKINNPMMALNMGLPHTKEELDKFINDKDKGVRYQAAKHPNLTKEHIDKLVNDKNRDVKSNIALHPKLTKEHIDKLVNDKDDFVRRSIAKHPNLTKEHIDKLVNDENYIVRCNLARHPNLTKKHIDKLINDKDGEVRRNIVQHPNLTKEHINKLVDDKNINVRYEIARHPNITKEHIDKLINDKDAIVRGSIAGHPKLTKEHIDKLVNDKDDFVRYNIAGHPKLTKEHIDKLVNDENYSVKLKIKNHPLYKQLYGDR